MTGGTGFVGSHVIKVFADRGFVVDTTARNLTREKRNFLASLGVREIFECDLVEEKGWKEAVSGHDLVCHVASPFFMGATKFPEKDFVNPAVRGTLNVLRAAAQCDSVKRVVLTSSMAAALHFDKDNISVDDWNEVSNLHDSPYAYSKAQAERAAWIFVGQHSKTLSFDLITILPGAIYGPELRMPDKLEHLNQNDQMLVHVLRKDWPGYPNISFEIVDVRDVAELHYLCATNPEAQGRYFATSGELVSYGNMADWILEAFPKLDHLVHPGSRHVADALTLLVALFDRNLTVKDTKAFLHHHWRFDITKSLGLGMKYRSPRETIVDSVVSLAKNPNLGVPKEVSNIVLAE